MKDEKNKLSIEIEISKCWFVYAQLMIILAGFLFTIAVMFYNNYEVNSRNLIEEEKIITNDIQQIESKIKNNQSQLGLEEYKIEIERINNSLEYHQEIFDKTENNLFYYNFFFIMGCICGVISFIFWAVGSYQLILLRKMKF